ncbi:MAG: hypothetical protein JWL90_3175 [Chthoniobacteraceae bacterium]|nr:hypothetical protein [Chthoniobacteraceae bacterium]
MFAPGLGFFIFSTLLADVSIDADGKNDPSSLMLFGVILRGRTHHFYLRMPSVMHFRRLPKALEFVLMNRAFLQSAFNHGARRIVRIPRLDDPRFELGLLNRGALGNEFEELLDSQGDLLVCRAALGRGGLLRRH